MLHYDQEAITRFCADHRAAITGLFRQAYASVGGHYTPLTPGALALEAEIDTQAFVTDVARGIVDVAAVRQAVLRAATDEVPDDLSRLAATFERLFCDFAEAQMARHPALAHELCRRCSNVMARRRAVVAATQMDLVLRRFLPAAAPPPPPPA
jgi:hypothetical protein